MKSYLLNVDLIGPNSFTFFVTPRASHVVCGRLKPLTNIYAFLNELLEDTLLQFLSKDLI